MLSYNDLTDLCDRKHVTITYVAEFSGMTLSGFRNATRKNALTADKIVLVCKALNITPNDFFCVQVPASGDTVYGDQQKGAKKQIIYKESEELKQTIQMLRDQLKAKDEQIAAKDQQINKLLGL